MTSLTATAPERASVETIVSEFYAKSLHIILESRIPALSCEHEASGYPASSSSSGPKSRDRWFNLALGECTVALENYKPLCRSFPGPMFVDILPVQPKTVGGDMPSPEFVFPGQHRAKGGSPIRGVTQGVSGAGEGTILERWLVQFESGEGTAVSSGLISKGAQGFKAKMEGDVKDVGLNKVQGMRSNKKGAGSGSGIQRSASFQGNTGEGARLPSHVTEVPAMYKRTIIMLRSLYSTCRLLPVYRLFKLANTYSHCCSFSLSYRMLSSAPPFSKHEESDMLVYNFTPVDTAYGRMRLSVAYRHITALTAVEVTPPVVPRIIADYVGSPIADPLKLFLKNIQSVGYTGVSTGRGIYIDSVPSSAQNITSGRSLERHHIWGGRVEPVQPTLHPTFSPSDCILRSPLPAYPFDSNPSPYPPSPICSYSQKHTSSDCSLLIHSSPFSSADGLSGVQPTNLCRQVGLSQTAKMDELMSPPFSTPLSHSPPLSYSQEGTASKGPTWSGSSLVSVPKASILQGSKFLTGDKIQHSQNFFPPLSPRVKKTEPLLRSSSESTKLSPQMLLHTQRSTSFETPPQLCMLHADCDQEVWRNEVSAYLRTVEKHFRGQSQATLYRASSKLVLRDDGDNENSWCPFAVDEDEAAKQQSSKTDSCRLKGTVSGSFSSLVQRSVQPRLSNAAVGALMWMLTIAPPLREIPTATSRTSVSGSPPVVGNVVGGLQLADLESKFEVLSLNRTKRANNALKELDVYKKMRDLMLGCNR